MKTRIMSILALGVMLSLHGASHAQQPVGNPGPGGAPFSMPTQPNPALAQAVVQALRNSGQLSRYQIQAVANGGMVDLIGEISDENQRAIAIHIARQVPGLVLVRDYLQVRSDATVIATQAPLLQPLPIPQPIDKDKAPPLPPRIDGPLPEPMPIFQPMPGPNPTMQPPPLPPYAWPTVAPYNNYSRVAYPQAHQYEQFPFIGPMYPFPRVPLGWRSVSLTWEDGHWWFHRNPTGHDWWRIRYW